MKRSAWISFVIVVQLLYSLFLIGFPVYLLALGDGWGVIFVSAALGGPGIVSLIGWLGLREGRFWGWSVALLADLVMFGILIYSQISDGWHNLDWEMAGMLVITGTISAALFIPAVRRSCWQGVGTRPVDRKQQRLGLPQVIICSFLTLLLSYMSLAIADHVGTPQFVRYVFSPGYVLGLRFSGSFGSFVLVAVSLNITYFGLLIFLLAWKINWPKLRKNPRHHFGIEP